MSEMMNIEHQGTVASAVDLMPDIDELERSNGDRDRDDVGRFKASQEDAGKDADHAAPVKTDDSKEPAKEVEAAVILMGRGVIPVLRAEWANWKVYANTLEGGGRACHRR